MSLDQIDTSKRHSESENIIVLSIEENLVFHSNKIK